ncbi:MAG: hypothetical protein JWQ06_1946 [Mucilaginibacter sp.]|nr:hypothetical protein [Mucilaginibacter sp.]
MNLSGIVSVSGKPGLWKALAQNKNGFVLESLDAQKTKLIANLSTAKLAALDEITIFGYEDDIKLTDIFERIKTAKNIPDAKADGKVLRTFFREIAPDHDEEKVYASDMKKVISWYHILKDMPQFNEEAPEKETIEAPVEASPIEEVPVVEASVKENKKEAVAKAPKPKKAPAKKG